MSWSLNSSTSWGICAVEVLEKVASTTNSNFFNLF
jgi:hypothetical protein